MKHVSRIAATPDRKVVSVTHECRPDWLPPPEAPFPIRFEVEVPEELAPVAGLILEKAAKEFVGLVCSHRKAPR